MRRRTLLGLLATSVGAGCAALPREEREPTVSPAPVPGESPTTERPDTEERTDSTDGPDESWSLVEFETAPVTVSLLDTAHRTADGGRLTLQFARTATDDHPATVRGTFRNENAFTNTFRLGGLPIFRNVPSAWPGGRPRDGSYTYRDELIIAPTDRHDIADVIPDLELATDDRWRLSNPVDGPWLPETHRLEAGEAFTVEYALVGRPEGDGFPRARYDFEGYEDRDVSFAVWSTDRPGPTGTSRFDEVDVQPLPEADSMAWTHDATPSSPTYITASREAAELPTKLDFTFVNHSRERVSGNPYFWRLWKLVDGQWFHIAPWGWPMPLLMLPPGGSHDWTLAAFPDHPISCEGAQPVGHLGGGRYAFEVGMGREGLTHASLLEFRAPPISIEPTEGLDVTRDGDVVRVDWARRNDEVPRAQLSLHRVAEAEARLLAEQLMQPRNAGLRNALAHLDPDVDRVNLVTDRNTVSRAARTEGYENGSFRFTLRGTAYEAVAEFGTG